MTIPLLHRHPLEDYIVGFAAEPNPHHLSVLRRPVVFSVLAHAGHETDIDAALFEMADISARFSGPAEWLVVSEAIAPESLVRDLAALGAQRASFLDQSEGRVVLRIRGPHVRKILAKVLGLDLHPDNFDIGTAAATLCCHVPANLARTGEDEFEIAVMRSYAGMVFEELVEMGREFAMTAAFAD